MTYYRLYFRAGGPDGRFVKVEEIEAANDVEARRSLAPHGDKFVELWQESRLVVSCEPQPVDA